MFGGSIVAVVTPMAEDGAIDFAAFERLLDWHAAEGTDGVVVAGTTGESPTVTAAETAELLRRAVARLRGRMPVIAGTGSNSTAVAIANTRAASAAGVDAVLVVTPYYNKPTQEGLFRHFAAVAAASAVPVILYNVPSRTACDLLPGTAVRLAALPRIAGIKEATGDLSRLPQLAAAGREFLLLSGDDATCREFMLAGGKGVISVTANVAPRLMHEMTAAALAGDAVRARELDRRLEGLHTQLFVEANPIATKWAVERLGLIPGGIRLPLTPLSARYHATVQGAMQAAGIV